MSQPSDEENEILDLIKFVDDHKCELFKNEVWHNWQLFLPIIGIFIIFATCLSILIADFVILKIASLDAVALVLSILAVFLSYSSFVAQVAEKFIVNARFKRVFQLTTFEKNEKGNTEQIILKALIKIRSKNQEFALKDIYKKHKQMFTKEKLIEKLYE